MDIQHFTGNNAVFVSSEHGIHPILMISNYEYKFGYTRKTDENDVWRCWKCKAKAVLSGGIILHLDNHTHFPETTKLSTRLIKDELKREAIVAGRGGTRNIVANALAVIFKIFL